MWLGYSIQRRAFGWLSHTATSLPRLRRSGFCGNLGDPRPPAAASSVAPVGDDGARYLSRHIGQRQIRTHFLGAPVRAHPCDPKRRLVLRRLRSRCVPARELDLRQLRRPGSLHSLGRVKTASASSSRFALLVSLSHERPVAALVLRLRKRVAFRRIS